MGLLFMFLPNLFAASGRLNLGKRNNLDVAGWDFRNLDIYRDNVGLLCLLALLGLLAVITHKEKFGSKLKYFCLNGLWGVVNIILGVGVVEKIYTIMSTDPLEKDYVEKIFGWRPIGNVKIALFFSWFWNNFATYFCAVLLLVGILLLYTIYKLKVTNSLSYFMVVGMMFFGGAIHVMGLQRGSRIASPSIFAIGTLCVLLAAEIDLNRLKWKIFDKCLYIGLMIILLVTCESDFFYVRRQFLIGQDRMEIAQELRKRQLMGEWDFGQYIVMPRYKETAIRSDQTMNNPSNVDMRYNILLRYYGLDERTRIIFCDDRDFVLLEDRENRVRASVFWRTETQNIRYRFKAIKDGEIFRESELSTANEWELESDYDGIACDIYEQQGEELVYLKTVTNNEMWYL